MTSATTAPPRLTCQGRELDTTPGAFGWLRDSTDVLDDPAALRTRMDRDGYLYLPGFFTRAEVAPVRRRVCEVLAGEGLLDPAYPAEEAVAASGVEVCFRPDIANGPARPELNTLV